MNIENTCLIFIIFKIYQCAEILKKSACIMKMVLRMKKIYEKSVINLTQSSIKKRNAEM